MDETKSKLISFAVLLALFLTAVVFASRYDRSENGFGGQTNGQQNTNANMGKKKKGNSNSMMNSNTAPNVNGTPN